MNELEFRYLRAVVAVADTRHFGQAAARLHLSQPPLTRMIAEAERVVGAKLFTRTTRQVSLTELGEVFVEEARAVLHRAAEAERVFAAAKRRAAGALRLSYTPLALKACLPPLLAGLRAQYHDVAVDLLEECGDMGIGNGVDMVFGDAPTETGIDSVLLLRESMAVLMPSGHRLSDRTEISLSDLQGEPIILHARHEYPTYYDRVMEAFDREHISPTIYHRERGQNCMALAVSGIGLLLTPSRSGWDAGLHTVPLLPGTPLHAEIWASWRSTPTDTLEKRSLIRLVREAAI